MSIKKISVKSAKSASSAAKKKTSPLFTTIIKNWSFLEAIISIKEVMALFFVFF
jgi:hypothetical protein